MFVIFHVPYFHKAVTWTSRNVMWLWGKHDAVDRNRLWGKGWGLAVKMGFEHLIIGFGSIYKDDTTILPATGDDFV